MSEAFVRPNAPMTLVLLTYTAALEDVDAHMGAHVAWLREGFDQGLIVLAGRRDPRTGGVILFRGEADAVAKVAASDPFVSSGVATFETVAFNASMAAPAIGGLLGMSVALIDYGAGNLHSVHNALKAAGARDIAVTADPDAVRRADRIVLPGVGAFGACAAGLRGIPDMVEAMAERVLAGGAPFLGVCVGMQLLADRGEELGSHAGLGWMPGTVRQLAGGPNIRVPHMGWNDVIPLAAHPLIEAGEAYFLHSFAFEPADGDGGVLARTDHGGPVTAAIGRDNIAGVQFHPEKSQRYGIALLERFLAWRP